MPNTSDLGYIELIGAIIQQAVMDATSNPNNTKSNKRHKNEKEDFQKDAMNFIFYPGRLENFVGKFHVESLINLDYIRRKTNMIIIQNLTNQIQEGVCNERT